MPVEKGGFVTLRHNSLRDLLAELLEEICKDVVIEPPLLPLTGENLPPGSNLSDGARSDVSCINLWSPLSRAFIDVRIFNPQAQSNWNKSISAMYTSHQNEKKTEYGPRTREVEKATLTAAVMSTSGGMGKEMNVLVRQIATKLSVKRGERYSDTVGFVRRRIRLDLLRTCVKATRIRQLLTASEIWTSTSVQLPIKVLEDDGGFFLKKIMTAAVMSTSGTSGGLSRECDQLVRQIAMKLSLKRGERYSDVVGFI